MKNSHATHIASVGVSVPPVSITQTQVAAHIDEYYRNELSTHTLELFHKILANPSIIKRHLAIDTINSLYDLKNEDPDLRVERFIKWTRILGKEAIQKALKKGNLSVKDVGALFVNTCTGYICPGISTYLIEDLGLSPQIKAYDLVGTGCGGALPNLQLASQFCDLHPNKISISLSVEICSAAFEMGNDISLLISNSIFGDGAAAALLWDKPAGVKLVNSYQAILPQFRDDVRFVHKNGRLYNKISKRLPEIIGSQIKPFVEHLLSESHISQDDITYYLIHSGGEKILDSCAESLMLNEIQMATSRMILAQYGNLSSPSILFELDSIFNRIEKNQWCLLLAFGAGLSIYGWLLKGV